MLSVWKMLPCYTLWGFPSYLWSKQTLKSGPPGSGSSLITWDLRWTWLSYHPWCGMSGCQLARSLLAEAAGTALGQVPSDVRDGIAAEAIPQQGGFCKMSTLAAL